MNKEIKEKWIKALRSGKYKQGKYNLCTVTSEVTKHCCLGVLCDLAVKEGIIPDPFNFQMKHPFNFQMKLGPAVEFFYQKFDGKSDTLPDSVQNWSGVNSELGNFRGDSLSSRNDNGASFEEIANVIEREF